MEGIGSVERMSGSVVKQAFVKSLPVLAGYVVLGLPCGILCGQAGMTWPMVLIMSLVFYSGAGQYMIPNMWLAASPIASIIASVSFVNTRQMLYATAFAPWCEKVSKRLSFWFAATVTDESFGVNIKQFEQGGWSVQRATLVNLCSQSSWTISCVVGVLIGNAIGIPLAIASFAMTSIFICLLVTQKLSGANVVAAIMAIVGVFACKLIGLSGPAIFFGALFGVLCAFVFSRIRERV